MSKLDEIVGKSAALIGEEIREWLGKKSATSTRQGIPQIHLSLDEQRTLHAGLASLAVTDSASGISRMPALGQLLESTLGAGKLQQLRDFPRSREVAMIVRGLPVDLQVASHALRHGAGDRAAAGYGRGDPVRAANPANASGGLRRRKR